MDEQCVMNFNPENHRYEIIMTVNPDPEWKRDHSQRLLPAYVYRQVAKELTRNLWAQPVAGYFLYDEEDGSLGYHMHFDHFPSEKEVYPLWEKARKLFLSQVEHVILSGEGNLIYQKVLSLEEPVLERESLVDPRD